MTSPSRYPRAAVLISLCCAAVCCAAVSTTLSACALTSKSDPLRPRYFSPETGGSDSATPASAFGAPGNGLSLRLGRVSASSNLREPIVFRRSELEFGYYDDRRWTERPEVYVRRALSRALFEQRGVTRAMTGLTPTLEVELVAFEEVRAPVHKARVRAIAMLHDQRVGRLEQTVTVEREIRDKAKGKGEGEGEGEEDDIDATVLALSEALQLAVEEISQRVLVQLNQIAQSVPSEAPAAAAPAIVTE